MKNFAEIRTKWSIEETSKRFVREAKSILRSFDYTDYEINVFIDDEIKAVFIPKPVFALSLINPELREWMLYQVGMYPHYKVAVVDQSAIHSA